MMMSLLLFHTRLPPRQVLDSRFATRTQSELGHSVARCLKCLSVFHGRAVRQSQSGCAAASLKSPQARDEHT